jgi:hypothetical protein
VLAQNTAELRASRAARTYALVCTIQTKGPVLRLPLVGHLESYLADSPVQLTAFPLVDSAWLITVGIRAVWP